MMFVVFYHAYLSSGWHMERNDLSVDLTASFSKFSFHGLILSDIWWNVMEWVYSSLLC